MPCLNFCLSLCVQFGISLLHPMQVTRWLSQKYRSDTVTFPKWLSLPLAKDPHFRVWTMGFLSVSLHFLTPLSLGTCWSPYLEHLLPLPYLANLNLTFNIKLKLSERPFCPHLHPPLFILRTLPGSVVAQLLSWTTTVVQLSSSLQPHGLQHMRLRCPSLSPGVCSTSCPLSQWCHPTISSSVTPFSSCLQSLPASGSFPMSGLFALGG